MMLLLLPALPAFAGEVWDRIGGVPPGSHLRTEEVSRDLVRFGFEGQDGVYWIDVTLGDGGGFCHDAGLVVQVRRDLAAEHESFDLDPVPAPVREVCAALPRLSRTVHLRAPEAPGAGVWQPGGEEIGARYFPVPSPRPSFFAVVLALGAVGAWGAAAALRARWQTSIGALGLVAVALAVRLRFSVPTTLLGGDAAYERLTTALGLGEADRYYGETWPALLGLVFAALRAIGQTSPVATDHVFVVNVLASSLLPAAFWMLCERMGLSRRAALIGAAVLVVLPHAVTLARIEDHFVLVSTLQVLGAAAALGRGRLDAGATVACAGLLAHLRPEQGPVAALLLLPLVARRAWVAAVLGGIVVAARLSYLPPATGHTPITFARLLEARQWAPLLGHFVGAWSPPLPGLWALAALGAGAALAGNRSARWGWAWAAATAAATIVPYLPKDLPAADPVRFSLPAAGWLVLFATRAGSAILERARSHPKGAGLAIVVVVLTCFLPVPLPERATPRPWVWEREFGFLRRHWADTVRSVGATPRDPFGLTRSLDGTVAWYDDSQDPQGAFARWLVLVGGVPVLPWRLGVPRPGDLVYRGSSDRIAEQGGEPWRGQACGLHPLVEEEVAPTTDGWVSFGGGPVRFAIYRVEDCKALRP